jgi:hypothetical protein
VKQLQNAQSQFRHLQATNKLLIWHLKQRFVYDKKASRWIGKGVKHVALAQLLARLEEFVFEVYLALTGQAKVGQLKSPIFEVIGGCAGIQTYFSIEKMRFLRDPTQRKAKSILNPVFSFKLINRLLFLIRVL